MTAIEISTGGGAAIVRVVDVLTAPELAEMVVVPVLMPLARPLALMLAAAGFEEIQLTEAVISWVEPSVNVPVAVNCWVPPWAMVGLTGVTAIDTSCVLPTDSTVELVTEPEVAAMVVVPTAALVAFPWLPALLLITATELALDVQVTVFVRFCIEPSVKVPVAVNC